MNWNESSNSIILEELGRRCREYRIKKNMTQQQLAENAGISLFTVAQIEKGKAVSMAMWLPLLRTLRLLDNLEMLLPEIAISPVELLKMNSIKKQKRIRPKKNK